MIKKYLMPTCMVLALLILAITYTKKRYGNLNNFSTNQNYFPSQTLISQLNFAKENIPVNHKGVMRKMAKALNKHHYKNVNTYILHNKAKVWFPIIEPILKQYGIPNDFKYIPLVESGLQSGVSRKGAAGYWQFMPNTARGFGLKVNGEVDERKNLRKSTIAACKYLKMLHKKFNNWTLVAAAYNYGDGSVSRQMKKQNQNNYFKLKLNRETANYVYSLIAMKEIIVSPEKHGYKPNKTLLAYAD